MKHLITLRKWSNVLGIPEECRKVQISPGTIMCVEELEANSSKNIGCRTRVDLFHPQRGPGSVLVWESSDEIDKLVAEWERRMKELMKLKRQPNA